MPLVTPELEHDPQVTYLSKHLQNSMYSGKSLVLVTHHVTPLYYVEIPLPSGIHSELIRHSDSRTTLGKVTAFLSHLKGNAPHWSSIVTQGWFKTIYLSYSCTEHSLLATEIAKSYLNQHFLKFLLCSDLQKIITQSDITLILGLLYEINTLIIIKFII